MEFISFWFGGVGLALTATIIGIYTQESNPLACIPFIIMFGFEIALTRFGFKTESKKAENEIVKSFKARIE